MRRHRGIFFLFLLTTHYSLLTGLTGCESLQKKFTRKPRTPIGRPSPVVTFRDYTEGVTPLDRYRKHFVIFEYWNDQLMTELQQRDRNPKRFRRASRESLQELQSLQGLLQPDVAVGLQPLLEARARMDQRLQHDTMIDSQHHILLRTLEAQTRQLNREFYWRKVQDRLHTPVDAGPP